MRAVPWFERIPSQDNPADALTKDGLCLEHLRNACDDSEFAWESIIRLFCVVLRQRSLPRWDDIASLYEQRFQ